MKALKVIFVFLYLLGLGVLLWTVILSGFNFTFNPDEIFNANTVYLMQKGMKPYVDFYTVYSPVFHWFITPVFLLVGFSFKAISAARVLMIGLFIVRLFLMFLLVKRVFGKKVALIFVPLFLLDPFMVFVGMQVRPENLMMVLYTLFLLVFSYALDAVILTPTKASGEGSSNKRDRTSGWLFFLSGLLCGFTLLTNIKIIPSLVGFGIVFVYFVIQKRLFSKLLLFVNGFCLAFLAFFAYFLLKGYLPEMFLHVFIDPFKLNSSIPYPTWLGYFYFSNPTIYGIDGKPLNWMYVWVLPVLGFAGGYKSLFLSKIERHSGDEPFNYSQGKLRDDFRIWIRVSLFLSLIFQWLSMLFIHSVFIQYYIPLNWLYAVFTAVFINDLLFEIKFGKIIKAGIVITILIVFVMLYKTSIQANLNRSKLRWDSYLDEFTKVWKMIPEEAPAFPNVVFRRPIYPILWGSTFAKYMRDRYAPAYLAIEKHKLSILTFLNDEYFGYLDKDTQNYIIKNYKRDSDDPLIWRRKK